MLRKEEPEAREPWTAQATHFLVGEKLSAWTPVLRFLFQQSLDLAGVKASLCGWNSTIWARALVLRTTMEVNKKNTS